MKAPEFNPEEWHYCHEHKIWFEKKLQKKAEEKIFEALRSGCHRVAMSIEACPMCQVQNDFNEIKHPATTESHLPKERSGSGYFASR